MHAPGLLHFLGSSLEDGNKDVRKYLVSALANMLRYEQKRVHPDRRAIHQITKRNIENMARLTSVETNREVKAAVLEFLGFAGDIRAIDPIFERIRNSSRDEYQHLEEKIQEVLFTREHSLAEKFRLEILKQVDLLLLDPDEQVKKRVRGLQKYMLSPSGMQA